jgi:hypothetical protein
VELGVGMGRLLLVVEVKVLLMSVVIVMLVVMAITGVYVCMRGGGVKTRESRTCPSSVMFLSSTDDKANAAR